MKSEIEVKKTTYQEVNNLHPNNTHRIIQSKTDVFDDTSRETGDKVVFDDVNLRGGFAQIPNIVLYDPLLSQGAKLCYALLLSYAWQANSCFPSQKLLARDLVCTTRTAMKALKELQKHKLIRIERLGQGKHNVYHILKFNAGYLPVQFIDRGSGG